MSFPFLTVALPLFKGLRAKASILTAGLLLSALSTGDSSIAILPPERLILKAPNFVPSKQHPLAKGNREWMLLSQSIDSDRFLQEIEQQQEFNDFTAPSSSSDVIVLGQPENFPYVIVIPGRTFEVLRQVQAVVPTAFITSSRRGRYIHTASFPERYPADALTAQLRHMGFDAQVAYIR